MKYFCTSIIIVCLFITAFAQTNIEMRYADKMRIREAMNISNQIGDKIWKGINDVPFVVILISDSVEFLINHPYPSNEFKLLGYDSILKTKVYYRPKQYDKHLLATFPAVNGVTCIVVGTPENTNKNSTEWIITLLHEHFHQYEYASPGYFSRVDSLRLSGGDQTGMWMLNYPFPYDSTVVIEQYKKYTLALSKTLAGIGTKEFQTDYNKYKEERNKFKALLKPLDYTYFSFQVWQEGVARYTEYKFLESLKNYHPSKEVSQLADFISFRITKDNMYEKETGQLNTLSLKDDKRLCFYALGFAEGLILDEINPKWHDTFLTDKFYIEHYSEN